MRRWPRRATSTPLVQEFNEALETARETAMLSPRRRAATATLDRYAESFTEVDFAIRDTRVLARHSVRLLRASEPVPATLPDAVQELGLAVWTLAGAYEQPERADAVRGHALRAGSLGERGPDRGARADPLDRGRPAACRGPDPRRRARAARGAN